MSAYVFISGACQGMIAVHGHDRQSMEDPPDAPLLRLSPGRPVGPALASRYPLDAVADPMLLGALRLWREAAPTGVLARSEREVESVLADPRLHADRATVIKTIGPDPLEWPIVYMGRSLFGAQGALAARVRDLAWRELAEATAASYADCIAERMPVVHRLSMFTRSASVAYDRLVLPSSRVPGGEVDTLLTVSVRFLPA